MSGSSNVKRKTLEGKIVVVSVKGIRVGNGGCLRNGSSAAVGLALRSRRSNGGIGILDAPALNGHIITRFAFTAGPFTTTDIDGYRYLLTFLNAVQ